MRFVFVTVIAAVCMTEASQIASAQQTYTIQNWPEDIATLPCDAFKRYPDGSWHLVAIVKIQNGSFAWSSSKDGGAAKVLEQKVLNEKCGVK
jgi:predicted metalloenzyme YecM